MAPTYTKESHASTTHYTTYPGWGIMCDNVEFYCDNEDYYCDGAVVMRDISHTSTSYNKETSA